MSNVKKVYTAQEKAVVVAKGETRLGKQHFFGHGDASVEKIVHRHIEKTVVEDVVETISYEDVFFNSLQQLHKDNLISWNGGIK